MSIKRKRAPYADTTVPPERTKAEIEKLLRDYGADGVQWTEHFAENTLVIRFILKPEKGPPILVQLTPPPFSLPRKTWVSERGHYETIDAPNWAQSLRLLKDYIRAKLNSIAYGLRDVEEEFLSDVLVRDRAGREQTVGEAMHVAMAAGELRPALPDGTATPKDRANVRDAESRVVP